MPVIHLHYIHDLTKEQKAALTAKMTRAVHEAMGVPTEHVRIWLHQTAADDHSIGGVLISELNKESK